MHLVRDLLDQALRDSHGDPAGRADDFAIVERDDELFVEAILTGGGILADDLGMLGRACEHLCRLVRRRPLRRCSIPWSVVSEVAEHALTVPDDVRGRTGGRPARSGTRLRAVRRLPARSTDGVRLHLIDLQVVDPRPREHLRVTGVIVRRRHRLAWPISLRPRQSPAGGDWRFVASSEVRLTRTALVVERTYDTLLPTRESSASRPPRRRARSAP
jgi:hypothetical protein